MTAYRTSTIKFATIKIKPSKIASPKTAITSNCDAAAQQQNLYPIIEHCFGNHYPAKKTHHLKTG
jgi:hypothetical protein